MGVIITTTTDSFKFDLNGMSNDREFARIRYTSIRSLVRTTNGCVEFVFNNGECHDLKWENIESFDGSNVTSQIDLYAKLEAKIFIP